MTEKRSNFLVRALRGLWAFIDGARRLVFNLVFLLLVVVVLAAVFRQTGSVVQPDSALVVDPMGFVVEQYTSEPLERFIDRARGTEEPETRFRDLVESIIRARDDDRIRTLVLEPDGIWAIGPAQLQELGRVIASFKQTGKRVVAYSEGMGQYQYYLAAMADEIWLHPEGLVLLEGFAVYRNYYKEALDKLAVNVHLFRVGEYKSAGEPFIRNDMSDDDRQANLYWLSSLWRHFLEDIATARGLSPAEIEANVTRINERLRAADGSPAQMALDNGLVDRIAHRAEFNEHLAQLGAWDEELQSYRQVSVHEYSLIPRAVSPLASQVAVIVAQGAITYGEQRPGAIGGESTAQLIRDARADPQVRAIVLRVDSPGGAVMPSEKIRHELQVAREGGLPVVISMGTVAASGGYWISMTSDEIWAEPTTITGSIGIFGLLTNIPDTLAKLGIHTDGVGTTELAGAFRIDRELSPTVADLIQQIIEDGYEKFIGKVADFRNMEVAAVDRIARGRVWTGTQALERGLVDKLGGMVDAVASAANLAGISEYDVVYLEEQPGPFEQWLLNMGASVPAGILASGPLTGLLPGLDRELPDDLQLLLSNRSRELGVFSYCFCQPLR